MTDNKLNHTLKVRIVPPNLLDVDETTGENIFDEMGDLRTLRFEFVDPPEGCRFGVYHEGVGDTGDPGFAVVVGNKPNKNYIRKPERLDDNKVIEVKISHRSSYSNGEWIYVLRAYAPVGTEYAEYSTMVARDGRSVTVTNPVIINR